jgi:hypothetical protein
MSTPRASVFTRTFLLLGFLILFHSQEPAALAGPQANSAPPSDSVKLKKDIEILAGFEGKWACQGVFPSSGKRIESQIVFAPDLEGVWLSVRHDDLPPNRYHAFELWGFDAEAKQLVAFIYDNFGGARKFTSPGWAEEELIWTGESGRTDKAATQRFVFRRDNPGQFVMNYEVKKGNSDWTIGDTITCKKLKLTREAAGSRGESGREEQGR